MGIASSTIAPFKEGASSLLQYSWVLWIFIPIAVLIFAGFMVKIWKEKKKQWTHTLRVRRVSNNGLLMDGEDRIKMRRFPLIRTGEVFELEHSLLGSYLIPELDAYTGKNEYSIILDTNNRIYTCTGEKFDKEKSSVFVSAKHSEIGIAMGNFRRDYQEVHKTPKRIELAQIAKFAMIGLLIIAIMIVSIKGIEQWGKNHEREAGMKESEAQAWVTMEKVMDSLEGNLNANLLLADKLKGLYGTNNLQGVIKNARNETWD